MAALIPLLPWALTGLITYGANKAAPDWWTHHKYLDQLKAAHQYSIMSKDYSVEKQILLRGEPTPLQQPYLLQAPTTGQYVLPAAQSVQGNIPALSAPTVPTQPVLSNP